MIVATAASVFAPPTELQGTGQCTFRWQEYLLELLVMLVPQPREPPALSKQGLPDDFGH